MHGDLLHRRKAHICFELLATEMISYIVTIFTAAGENHQLLCRNTIITYHCSFWRHSKCFIFSLLKSEVAMLCRYSLCAEGDRRKRNIKMQSCTAQRQKLPSRCLPRRHCWLRHLHQSKSFRQRRVTEWQGTKLYQLYCQNWGARFIRWSLRAG